MKAIRTNVMVIEKKVEEKKSEGGIILSSDRVDFSNPIKAEVYSIGNDVKEVKVGDEVYYPPKSGYAITVGDVVYRIFDEKDVVAIA